MEPDEVDKDQADRGRDPLLRLVGVARPRKGRFHLPDRKQQPTGWAVREGVVTGGPPVGGTVSGDEEDHAARGEEEEEE